MQLSIGEAGVFYPQWHGRKHLIERTYWPDVEFMSSDELGDHISLSLKS